MAIRKVIEKVLLSRHRVPRRRAGIQYVVEGWCRNNMEGASHTSISYCVHKEKSNCSWSERYTTRCQQEDCEPSKSEDKTTQKMPGGPGEEHKDGDSYLEAGIGKSNHHAVVDKPRRVNTSLEICPISTS